MNVHKFSNETLADFLAYHNRGDMAAGRRIADELAASGTSMADLAHAAEQFKRTGGDSPILQAVKSSREATQQETFQAGVQIHNEAVAILESQNLEHTPENYAAAIRAAELRSPGTSHVYHHGVKLGTAAVSALKRHAESVIGGQSPIMPISNLATALPRNADGSIDFEVVARAANEFIDEATRRQAAQNRIDELIAEKMKNVPGSEVEARRPFVVDEVKREHAALASTAKSGHYTAEALRDLLWSLAR